MKACGIIVEYNPFHNGHLYHAKQAKELSQSDVVIAVMSGNFLQRGEPAIVDKWSRANQALHNGVDLVIELPIQWSIQAADYFARGSVMLLQAMQCDYYCFGTDTREPFDYQAFGNFVAGNREQIDYHFNQITESNRTYAQKMTQVYQELYPDLVLKGEEPNHILALSYAQENACYQKPMTGIPIQRIGADYHSKKISHKIASATAIRHAVHQGLDIKQVAPLQTTTDLSNYHVSWENYWPLLNYRIRSSSIEELGKIYQMVDGLEYRLKKFITQANSFEQYVSLVKTKRYSQTRVQRLLLYVLLNLQTDAIHAAWEKNYLHVLGYTEQGKAYLNANKQHFSLPVVSRFGKSEGMNYPLATRSDYVYQLGNPAIEEQNFGRFPIQVKSL